MKRTIVYIAGLGHSGSTLLDLLLGSHSKMIGLGEIMPFIRRKNREIDNRATCSCGKKGNECDFWSKADEVIKNTNNETDAYIALANYFFEKYGDETLLVDSSKNSYPHLQKVSEEFNLKILFLTRDYRSWTFSRYADKGGFSILWAYRWFAENKKIEYQLKKMNLEFYKVGYEELALYPDFILKKVCKFIDVDFEENMLSPDNTNSHIINGNLLRADKEKRSSIKYDARWMTSGRISRLSAFLPFVKFNKKNVFSNVLGNSMKPDDFELFSSKRRKNGDLLHN